MTKRDWGRGLWDLDPGSAQYTCPVSCSARGPALRLFDKKRVSVQQGSPFGHGWECDGKEKVWRRMTSRGVRKLSFLPFCQRSERRIKERKMEHNCDDEKENGWVQTCSFHGKKSLYKINE